MNAIESCSDFECRHSPFLERLALFTLAVWPVSSFEEDRDVVSGLCRLRHADRFPTRSAEGIQALLEIVDAREHTRRELVLPFHRR